MVGMTSIPEFYAGCDVFITGATGFMGKVLLEKLLRSCPDIKTIYLLMRAKKGKTPEERIKQITQLPLFEPLTQLSSSAVSKLVPIYGDVMEEGLGISQDDLKRLMDVSIIFHVAASVRFDEPLRDAVVMNTKGTQQVLELALKMKKIKVILHVSTAFCNCDRMQIDEKLYPAHADWRKTLEIVEKTDSHTLSILSNKYIGKLPNTYTFSKSLAEHVVKDYQHLLPVVIFRPSIIMSSWKEPVEGWMDNLNGPGGLIVGGAKGILRSLYGDENSKQDYIPVDVVVKAAIIASWQRGIQESPPEELPIYNCSSVSWGIHNLTVRKIHEFGRMYAPIYPPSNVLWTMHFTVSKSKLKHYIKALLVHLLPALLIDLILRISGNKPMLTQLQKRVYVANNALAFFMLRSWSFCNQKFLALEEALLPKDKNAFTFDISNVGVEEYFLTVVKGGRKYVLKDDPETYPSARIHYQRMCWVEKITKGIFLFCICYIMYKKGIWHSIFNSVSDILEY